ncbi:hypothetical protein KC614_00530 [candidate division WWE3 bacterium]|uniref:Uncharacterized protein n=1 Tax=candidate division WWE3 bacterium TaxID=2053526 RepID=A0A955RRM0_UNCKA|nr:hypothetical protein [candidate division WWE3 bacterium]
MNNSLGAIAGVAFLAIVGLVFGYYVLYFTPYAKALSDYDVADEEYQRHLKQCYVELPVDENCIGLDCSRGVVAGCADIEKPVEPELPMRDVVMKIGEYLHVKTVR